MEKEVMVTIWLEGGYLSGCGCFFLEKVIQAQHEFSFLFSPSQFFPCKHIFLVGLFSLFRVCRGGGRTGLNEYFKQRCKKVVGSVGAQQSMR